jgi:hypothetical protein
MRQRITRFSPHQNGKVFGVLMAITSLVLLLPMMLIVSTFAPPQSRPPMFLFVLMPLIYLVMGYVSVAIGCWIYNLLAKATGGIEFESREQPT